MTRSDEARLDDIRLMCQRAADAVRRGRPAIESDELLLLGLERAIEIAGEAATQLSEETRARYPEVEWVSLLAVRVLLAHAYHRRDVDQLWTIAADDLPTVAEALGPLVENEPG